MEKTILAKAYWTENGLAVLMVFIMSGKKHTNTYVCSSENRKYIYVEMTMVLLEGIQNDRSIHDSASNNMMAHDHFHNLADNCMDIGTVISRCGRGLRLSGAMQQVDSRVLIGGYILYEITVHRQYILLRATCISY